MARNLENTKKVKNYFDRHWSKNNIKNQEKSTFGEYEKEATNYAFHCIKSHFNSLKNKDVLEIGPGNGNNILKFAKLGANVTAIDVSKKSLQLSKDLMMKHRLLDKVKFVQMDVHNLKFRKNEFDIVFIQSTLMYLKPSVVAKQCSNVLKKNGLFVFIEPTLDNFLIRIYRTIFSEFKETNPKYISYRQIISISKLFRSVRIQGFYIFSFACLLFGKNNFLQRSAAFILKKIENLAMIIFPQLEKKAWLYVSINIK
jgi:ubiquinone/menaquinone biosynthesis C-methylase UbiE|tara:strand:+ start:1148 stop:1915 length:768 start_codon:yes stop_codon:yes gene_type:complete